MSKRRIKQIAAHVRAANDTIYRLWIIENLHDLKEDEQFKKAQYSALYIKAMKSLLAGGIFLVVTFLGAMLTNASVATADEFCEAIGRMSMFFGNWGCMFNILNSTLPFMQAMQGYCSPYTITLLPCEFVEKLYKKYNKVPVQEESEE